MYEVSQILIPVADVGAAASFYESLGFPVIVRDGDRYALLQAGAVKLALADASQRDAAAGSAIAFKVGSLEEVGSQLANARLSVPKAQEGPHERSIEISDPDGQSLLFYEPIGR